MTQHLPPDPPGFAPLLAGKAPSDLESLRYPVFVSPKLDGIRCIIRRKAGSVTALSRKLLPIPNQYVQQWVADAGLPDGLDGELLLQDWTAPFSKVSSAIMSRDGEPDFCFAAFDFMALNRDPFKSRYADLVRWAHRFVQTEERTKRIDVVQHDSVADAQELMLCHEAHLTAGYEGTMIRCPDGIYKFGRSTTREGILLKLKCFEDEEAYVVGAVELEKNANDLGTDELGHAKRSSAKEGMVKMGTLGALICQFDDGTEFQVGSGFTNEMRALLWADICRAQREGRSIGELMRGRWATIRYQPPPGGRARGEKPRIPVFKGFRED